MWLFDAVWLFFADLKRGCLCETGSSAATSASEVPARPVFLGIFGTLGTLGTLGTIYSCEARPNAPVCESATLQKLKQFGAGKLRHLRLAGSMRVCLMAISTYFNIFQQGK